MSQFIFTGGNGSSGQTGLDVINGLNGLNNNFTDGTEGYCGVQSTVTSEVNSITLPVKRFSLSLTTTIFLVGKATFSAGTCAEFGSIYARRIR